MKRSVIILLHIGYWLVYLLLVLIILLCLNMGASINGHSLLRNFPFDIFFSFFTILPAIPGFYIFYGVLFSKFLARKKILFFFLALIAVALVSGIAGAVVLTLLAYCKIGPGIFADGWNSAIPVTIIMSVIALLNGIVGLVMKGFISWYDDIKLKEELNKKNHATELALVKSQLDPHFLFNTINNIDVLIEKDATMASAYLNRLSHIMRFMLYETKTEKISFQKELEYIEKYIELQKIRTANTNYVNYTMKGTGENLQITPMLFIPFIENAFKHAENRKIDNGIEIHFEVAGAKIIFECNNTCSSHDELLHEYNGLGNELMTKRLQLLYPDKHQLSINRTPTTYKVKLEINCE